MEMTSMFSFIICLLSSHHTYLFNRLLVISLWASSKHHKRNTVNRECLIHFFKPLLSLSSPFPESATLYTPVSQVKQWGIIPEY